MFKRLFISIMLALLAVMFIGNVVLAAWEYYFPIYLTDTSNATRTYHPVLLGFGGLALFESNKINADGTNTNMQIGSSDIKYMMSTTNVTAVIPTLYAKSLVTVNLYTGYTPVQTAFSIITGEDGYVGVSDNADMELGDNFSMSLSGYINTSALSTTNIFYKQDAFRTYVSGAENITAAISVPTYSWTSPTGNIDVSGNWTDNELAYDESTDNFTQEDILTASWGDFLELTHAALDADGVRYYADTDAFITDIDVDYSVNGVDWFDVYQGAYADETWETKAFAEGVVANVTEVRFRFYNADVGTQTCSLREVDFREITGYTETETTVSGVTSDVYTVTASANTTDLILDVSGSSNSVALAGAIVLDNVNDWVFAENVPYADNITLSVDGVSQLLFSPTVMLDGANIPDESMSSHNGTITWGTNSDLDISYWETISYEAYSVPSANITGGFVVPNAIIPATWFASGENVSALPFYDSFNDVALQTGIRLQTLYSLAIIGVAFGAFIAIVAFTRSALMAYIAMVILFGVGASMTIIPAWIVFVLIVIGAGIMYLYRQVAY